MPNPPYLTNHLANPSLENRSSLARLTPLTLILLQTRALPSQNPQSPLSISQTKKLSVVYVQRASLSDSLASPTKTDVFVSVHLNLSRRRVMNAKVDRMTSRRP